MKPAGPLAGIKVLEIESIGPGPFAAMVLADMGANVLRIARASGSEAKRRNPVLDRGRSGTVTLNLKNHEHIERVMRLIGNADAMIEGFRPGVMERLGLGPETCLQTNPRIVYGRMTGWGRTGPLAQTAGHDINYIGLTGALYACGTAESGPVPPLNLVGDFGGGGLMLAFGMVCALLEARTSGRGQIVDAAMIDGASLLMSMMYGMRGMGLWPASRAGNLLDGSAYFYTCYECRDGGWMAVGAIEPQFRRLMLQLLGLGDDAERMLAAPDDDREVRTRIAEVFKTRTRAEWQGVFEGTDACVSPVLDLEEAALHAQNGAWGTFSQVDGVTHPNPAPRFSRSSPARPDEPDDGTRNAFNLQAWGLSALDVECSNSSLT
jgi:alpha-methylacyl-CoA racemase